MSRPDPVPPAGTPDPAPHVDDDENGVRELSRDRTQLAAERTYAAWLRTGLSIAAGGIAIVRLLPDDGSHVSLVIGGAFVLLGIAIFGFGARQFAQTTGRIRDGRRPEPTTPRTAYLLTALLAVLLVVVLVFMARNPSGAGEGQSAAPPATVG